MQNIETKKLSLISISQLMEWQNSSELSQLIKEIKLIDWVKYQLSLNSEDRDFYLKLLF